MRAATGNQGGRRAKKEVEICSAATPQVPFFLFPTCRIALHDVFIKTQGETLNRHSILPPPCSYPTLTPTALLAQVFGYFEDGSLGRRKESRAASLWTPPLGSTSTLSCILAPSHPPACPLLLSSPKIHILTSPCNRDSISHN